MWEFTLEKVLPDKMFGYTVQHWEGFSGVHINTYGNFRIFYRHKSFVDNPGDGILGG